MELHYLDFDFSDEDSGRGSFDAMATVFPHRMPALLAEISAVLRWARQAFGPAGALQDDGEWDYLLEGIAEPDTPLEPAYDGERLCVHRARQADCGGRALHQPMLLELADVGVYG